MSSNILLQNITVTFGNNLLLVVRGLVGYGWHERRKLMQEKKCKDRIDDHFQRTVENYQKAKDFFDTPKDQRATNKKYVISSGEYGSYEDFFDYVNKSGLSFDYVTPFTFKDQPEAYYRFEMSWGGPSDEFNIYTDSSKNIQKIEYWFKDWFDGASLDCTDNKLIKEMCWGFVEGASYPHEYLQKEQKEIWKQNNSKESQTQ